MTNKKFSDSLQAKNHLEIINCIQIFNNLEKLAQVLEEKANLYLKTSSNTWKACLTKSYPDASVGRALF